MKMRLKHLSPPRGVYFGFVLAALLFASRASAQNVPLTLPFQSANWSVLDPDFDLSDPVAFNQRALIINLPPSFAFDPVRSSTNNNLNGIEAIFNWSGVNGVNGGGYFSCPDGSGYLTAAGAVMSIMATPLQSASPNTSVAQEIASVAQTDRLISGPAGITVPMKMEGGFLAGQTIMLKGQYAIYEGVAESPCTTLAGGEQSATSDHYLVLALDWGTGLRGGAGSPMFLIVTIDVDATVSVTGNSTCGQPACDGVASSVFGQPSADAFVDSILAFMVAELNSGAFSLEGAAPDELLFYDFGATNSVDFAGIVPVLPPTITSATAVYPYINQYDAGIAFGLPVNSSDIAGYAACGPESLSMALCALGFRSTLPAVQTIYSNTVDPSVGSFNWDWAKAWLGGAATHNHGVSFPSAYPASAGPLYPRKLFDTDPNRFASDWAAIDAFLAAKHPVLIHTDLSANHQFNNTHVAGGGHIILLLGQGNSDYVAAAYGLPPGAGKYYIVADPAGHYFADPANSAGLHYATIEDLRANGIGVNYGGAFAIYPKAMLQERTCADSDCTSERMTALLFGATNYAMWQVQSPVTLVVTDPSGNQTGIDTNGSVLEAIADSEYQPEVEENEDGGQTIVSNGSKSVVVNNPAPGTYRADLIGTSSGPYTFIFQYIGANGAPGTNYVQTGSVVSGEHLAFTFDVNGVAVNPTGPSPTTMVSPRLTNSGFSFSIATQINQTYIVQQSTSLSTPNWAAVTNLTGSGSTLQVVVPATSVTQQFFRVVEP